MSIIPTTARKGRPLVSLGGGNGVQWGEFPDPTNDPNSDTGSGYASLTGAGETATPGDLEQLGGLTVVDGNLGNTGDGIILESFGGYVESSIEMGQQISGPENGIVIAVSGTIDKTPGTGITLTVGSYGGDINITAVPGNINIGAVGAGTPPIVVEGGAATLSNSTVFNGEQASGGTLAGVIAGLVALGLFSS